MFNKLKARFCSAPILKPLDPALETPLEMDATDYVVSGILSQRHPDPTTLDGHGTLHPVAFLSEKMYPTECNYGIGDKELLAIIACLEKWYMYLHGVPYFQEEGSSILHHQQYGSVRGRSAVDVLYKSVVKARQSLEGGGSVGWAFWDVKGGFQNVRSADVLARMESCTPLRCWLPWLGRFMSPREFEVA